MYWPAATPRIYATSNSRKAAIPAVAVSHDGANLLPSPSASPLLAQQARRVPSRLQTHGAAADPVSGVASSSPTASHDALGLPIATAHAGHHHPPLTPSTPMTPAIQSVEHGYHHDGHDALPPRPASPLSVPATDPVLALRLSRSGHLFVTITATSMTIWQTKPTVVLAVVVRSDASLTSYGDNVDLLLRPDSAIIVVSTSLGFLITYSLATDAVSQVYKPQFTSHTNVQRRRQNHVGDPGHARPDQILWGPGEGAGVRDISVRFRMVIKVDAGIESALALDDELVVATTKPAAVQCIRWTPDSTGSQTSTEILSRMGWLDKKVTVSEMTYDKPMSLATWVTSDGKAYAVQRSSTSSTSSTSNNKHSSSDVPASSSSSSSTTSDAAPHGMASSHKKLFRGYCFHVPSSAPEQARRATINARFSLVAVGCADGAVRVYSARDYVGNIPPSHVHPPPGSPSTTGSLTKLTYSPDGYCLLAGYEKGWATWSVYGKPLGHSFQAERGLAQANGEEWLSGVRDAAWVGGSCEILLVANRHEAVWLLEMARSAAAGCYSPANLFRTVLQTNQNIMVYRGYDLPDMTTISAEPFLWHTARIPATYLLKQWPIRCTVISADGRYVAVAGRRGLAHYSVHSGRWRTFGDAVAEDEFQVRGGMCWYQNVLVAAVEVGRGAFELRLFARDAALDRASALHVEAMPAPVVLITPSGEDSLLVYTYDNVLYHFVFAPSTAGAVRLVQVGQIGFHGIVRSPARVRGLSWILPDSQLYDGDPSQDVAVASVLVLVDGKLVLFRPSLNDEGHLKYDMRIIAQSVEYYVCMKDQPFAPAPPVPTSSASSAGTGGVDKLLSSLWLFDGGELKVWPDTTAVLDAVVSGGDVVPPVAVAVDFYPLSVLLAKGIVLGVEPDLVQRRDVNFSFFRFAIRTHLFLPDVLRFYLRNSQAPTALRLAQQYQNLTYFAHALEILLHQVLDEEVDSAPAPDAAVLPRVLSLLSSFRPYLDIVVQCTRKTEVRSWRTLFAYLPPPQELFEESLLRGNLKTAGGYLLILHTFDELATASEQGVRLLRRAMREGDWDLCKELARFLAAMDDSGQSLRDALASADVSRHIDGSSNGPGDRNTTEIAAANYLTIPRRNGTASLSESDGQSVSDDSSMGSTTASER